MSTGAAGGGAFEAQPYHGIATFGRAVHARRGDGADVAVVGIPYDSATSYRSGARFGPRAIREQSLLLWGYHNPLQVAPFRALRVIDYGDVHVVPVDIQATAAAINAEVGPLVAAGAKILALGGDHSVSLPLLRVQAAKYGPLAVVHFDAHPDTWEAEFPGQRYSHGTPFRRAIEEGLVDTSAYFQVGLRGPTAGPQDYADARALGAKMITTDDLLARGVAEVAAELRSGVGDRRLYVSLDVDMVDPAYAPGTGTPEVGGPTSHQLLQLLRGLQGLNLVGADLVEVCPPFDHSHITAILAANLAFEMLCLMALTAARAQS